MEKLNRFLTPIAIIVAGLIIAGAIFYVYPDKEKGKIPNFLSAQEAAEKAINYINKNKDILTGGTTASLINVMEENGLYKFRLKLGDQEFDSYVTKDGKLLFASAIDLEKDLVSGGETSAEVQKSDRPDVKLFVMSYCPYGLQAQKMFLPVYDLLKDKVDMGVYFVDYIMHGKQEIDENLRQYCIEKEQKEKYYDYLSCFVKNGSYENLEAYKDCLKTAGIDEEKLNNCISQTDKEYKVTELYNDKSTWVNGNYPQFNIHKDLNDKYGVRGSPTIVINDTEVSLNDRSPETFKNLICQAFNNPPEECSQTLSNTVFSSGFGLEETDSSSGGGCGQ